ASQLIDRCQHAPGHHVAANACEGNNQRKTQDEDDEDFTQLLLDARLGTDGGFGGIAALLLFQLFVELVSNRQERSRRVDDQQHTEHRGIPGCEPNADRRSGQPAAHGSPSCSTKPTPRTVWINATASSGSTFLRSRVICTSITLSIGVARRGSFHTSRASIS